MKTQILSTRIDEIYAREIQQMAREEGLDKSSFLKKIIISGLKDYKLEHSLALYNKNRITLSRASELAEISIHEFISLMPDHNMEIHYSSDDFRNDLELKL